MLPVNTHTSQIIVLEVSVRIEVEADQDTKIDYKTEPKLLRFSQSTPWFPSDEKEK